jgi:hypothetical protein
MARCVTTFRLMRLPATPVRRCRERLAETEQTHCGITRRAQESTFVSECIFKSFQIPAVSFDPACLLPASITPFKNHR